MKQKAKYYDNKEGVFLSPNGKGFLVRVKSNRARTPFTNWTQRETEQLAWESYHQYYDENLNLEREFKK